MVNYRNSDNPYKAQRAGNCEDEIKKVSHMSAYICITDFIQFVYNKSSKVMKGAQFGNNWYFYHDALSLMKVKDTKEWMIKQGIFAKWILPLNDLNKGKPFAGHPVGNLLELILLECPLCNDFNQSVNYHINITRKLDEEDDIQFSM